MSKQPKVLLIIEQCTPDSVSVPLVGYRFFQSISQLVDATLVTHIRNKPVLDANHPDSDIVYIAESKWSQRYYQLVEKITCIRGKIIWPLRLALSYPAYEEFNQRVYHQFHQAIEAGTYDVVHAITPMVPRYPIKASKACVNTPTPFVLGPVNGGIPFPEGFESVARNETAGFNFLRAVGRYLIPGYRSTYKKADHILAGSSYTAGLIKRLFPGSADRVELFYENGLQPEFILEQPISEQPITHETDAPIELLFAGRLVSYKSADILIDAISQLSPDVLQQVHLNIIGDGPERVALEAQTKRLNLQKSVTLTGWIDHSKTPEYYKQADIFCFPSIREFGGAVVLEAMASGLPCIVVNYGGIGEYVTPGTGFKIDPVSREFISEQLTQRIEQLVKDPALRREMSENALQHAKAYTWEAKAQEIVEIYNRAIAQKRTQKSVQGIGQQGRIAEQASVS